MSKEPEQLLLWSTDEETAPARLYTIDDIIVAPSRWADGDTSLEALERLAMIGLGDLTTFKDTEGQKHVYYAISAGIVDGEVLHAYEYYCPLKWFYHLKFGLPIPTDVVSQRDEEEDEEF